MKLAEDQTQFLTELRATGLSDGIAVPIFSAIGDMAFFGLGVRNGELALDDKDLAAIVLACQLTHNCYVAQTEPDKSDRIMLSPREKDVLMHAAFGENNRQIALSYGIAPSTADTLLRRCFRKLNAKPDHCGSEGDRRGCRPSLDGDQ